MKHQLKISLAAQIAEAGKLSVQQVLLALEKPKNASFGDIAYPCFELAKTQKKKPNICAEQLAAQLKLPEGIQSVSATGPFLNFRFSRAAYIEEVLERVFLNEQLITTSEHYRGMRVAIEYSSPNIAKTFHVGHLRTTLIGNCLDRVYRALESEVVSINHLGDWGTQFGFVWAGCELWGKPADPTVRDLVEIYRKATAIKEAQENGEQQDLPDVNEMARNYFLQLEEKEPEAIAFWKWCLEISMDYLHELYQKLNVSFEHYLGESFYSDKIQAVEQEFRDSNILEESQGALGVDLGEKLGFARIFTPDGRSLYLTRDIAAAEYRAKTFPFDRSIYVVGRPQTLHFEQLKALLQKLGKSYAEKIQHVSFGHVLGMKTRGEGEIVELNDFLDEAKERALTAYREQVSKRPEGLDEQEVAEKVALAAILFSNLSRTRNKDVNFSWKHALEFQGDTGPYLLYAYARINGIKEKAFESGLTLPNTIAPELLTEESAYRLAALLGDFTEALERTADDNEPNHLASYALDVAKAFSSAYNELKVVGVEKQLAETRLALFEATSRVLKQAIELLGMRVLERM